MSFAIPVMLPVRVHVIRPLFRSTIDPGRLLDGGDITSRAPTNLRDGADKQS